MECSDQVQTIETTHGNARSSDLVCWRLKGNMVDYLFKHKTENDEISVKELWKVVIYGLQHIWPESRTRIDNQNMGDVWELS